MTHLPHILRVAAALTSVGLAVAPMTANAAVPGPTTDTPPAAYGSTWDDPRTAAPEVPVPDTEHCSVTLVQHGFDNWDVLKKPYAPPAACAGDWSKVVLKLDGHVKGHQYDRLGWLDVNGVRLLTTSTPEPNPTGVSWHVEKDVTDVQAALRKPGETAMYIGNTVNETYTGVINVTVTLDFYKTSDETPKTDAANLVLPLEGVTKANGETHGSITLPQSTERVAAEVYATGSGGGCEEFWDTSVPASTGGGCADGLPYREVDVYIDGQLAGIAQPMAYIYTGGWSNPYLWFTIPSPGAFNIRPLQYDLTPFVGVLNDGKAHEVRVKVLGGPSDGDGWTVAPAIKAWTAKNGKPVKAGLVSVTSAEPRIDSTVTGSPNQPGQLAMDAQRKFTATGWADTQTGRVTTTVTRSLANVVHHDWNADQSIDNLDSVWIDHEIVTSKAKNQRPSVKDTARSWNKKGTLKFLPHDGIANAYDVTTTLKIGENAIIKSSTRGRAATPVITTDRFDGTATWMYGVPRDKRVATSTSSQVYTSTGDRELGCYRHELAATNGRFTTDKISHSC